MKFNTIQEAVDELKKGSIIILLDEKDRENEGDLICAASKATVERLNFMIDYARGPFLITFMTEDRARELDLSSVCKNNTSPHKTNFMMSVDHMKCKTGSSVHERLMTIKALGDKNAKPSDFVRPGHMIPIASAKAGLSERKGHTEAAVELMKLAGFDPAVALGLEIVSKEGHMATEEELFELSKRFDLKIIHMRDLV